MKIMNFNFSMSIPSDYSNSGWLYLAIAAAIICGLILVYILIRQSKQTSLVGSNELVGMIGEVRTKLDPEGQVFVRGELWKAKAAEPIAKGEKVEVVKVQDMVLKVKKYVEEFKNQE
jgi:membrane-bound serine protease (ClpP class)